MNPRELIARRVAGELKDGDVVNLGVGLPTMVTNYIPEGVHIILQAENGMLGIGPMPAAGDEDPDMIDAGGNYVSVVEGGAFFDSTMSFSIIRGGHVDITVLGGMEVDQEGNLANWIIPGKMVSGMGGAMDLVVGAKKVIVAMEHLSKKGTPKILKKCRLPLTAVKEVDMIVTDMAVMQVTGEGLVLREIAPGFTVEDVRNATEADFIIASELKVMCLEEMRI